MNSLYDPDALASNHATDFATSLNRVYNFTYGWMAVGLLISGIIAYFMGQAMTTGALTYSSGLMTGCCILEFLMVIGLSALIHKLSMPIAALLFTIYAALNGVTLSVIFLIFDLGTIQSVFFVTAGTFAGVALFGSLTSKNLSNMGRFCFMALWGVIIASLVNIFMRSSGLNALISYVGVFIFVGLTAWDAQKVRLLAEQQHRMDAATVHRLGLICALELYLDFVNLFIYLLRIFGGKGRD